MSIIKIDSLTRDYGNLKGVFDVSLEIEEGEVFGFLGPNGAGKTTTIRHIMGFLKPEKGTCTVFGESCWDKRASIQRNLGYIPGEIAFFDEMTGIEFLNFIIKYRGIGSDQRAKELIEYFELDPRSKLSKMSKGTKQKVGIIAAFMHDPDVIVLDEPTSGLDPLMQSKFIELILREKAKGKTILMSSHIFEEVERTCHRVAIIKEGKIVTSKSVDELKQAQIKKYQITLNTTQDAINFAKEIESIEVIDNQVTIAVQNNLKEFIAIMNRYPVTDLTATNQSLEEIFMHYYGGEKDV